MGSIRGEGGAGGGGGGLADLVDDTTPQLGGNLDVNGHNVGGVTPTELGYLSGATSAIQTQLGNKQASNANLDALAGQTGAADRISYWTAASTLALATLTAFGRSLIAAADAAGVRTLLGLGTAATTDASAYQAADAELTALAGLTSAADRLPYFTGSGTASLATFTAAGRALVDDADAAAQRTTLGLGNHQLVTVDANGNVAVAASNVGASSSITSRDNALTLTDGLGNGLVLNIAGANKAFFAGVARFASSYLLGFSSSTNPGAANSDVAYGRNAAGVAEINSGTASDYRDLKLRKLESTQTTGTAPLTVASTTVVANLNADKLDGLDAADLIAKSIVTTKGDIIGASASATVARLGVGTNGQVLTADSDETLGIKWATPSGGGAAISTPQVAYVETDGNNGTAVLGDPSKPFLTLAAAIAAIETSAVEGVVQMGVGNFAADNYSGAPPVYVRAVRGRGRHATLIGGGFYFQEAAPAAFTFSIFDCFVDSVAYYPNTFGTAGGALTLLGDNAEINALSATGAEGTAGDGGTPGGSGGGGGILFVRGRLQIAAFSCAGGDGGADGGAGAGMAGADGTSYFNGAALNRSGASPTRYTAATCACCAIESGYFGGSAYTDNGGNGTYC